MYSRCKFLILLTLIFFFFFPKEILANVLINEISSYESTGDWVELYSYEDATISGWILRDTSSTKVATIPENISIGPSFASLFYVIDAGNRLNKDGDIIKLYRSDDSSLEDSISYGSAGGVCAPSTGESIGRVENGNTIERFSTSSRGLTNSGISLNACPTSTPEPTVTSTPTSTTTPTSTPTKTATATPTKTATAKPTTTATPKETPIEESEAKNDINITGADVKIETSPEGIVAGATTTKKSPLLSILFIISGVGFLGYGGYLIYNKKHETS